MLSEAHVIEIFKALADPNRLRLFESLLHSDRTNSELMSETGLSQNLLSHHLAVLTDTQLIKAHQSIADARRRYYSPNLETAHQLIAWWNAIGLSPTPALPALRRPCRVLFLCYQNADRSLIAEAVANHLAAGALSALSAGMETGGRLTPEAQIVLREKGISHVGLVSKTYHHVLHESFDCLITVCDRVHENVLPSELARLDYIHWSLPDPVDETDDPAERLILIRELYTELEQRLMLFVKRLAASQSDVGQTPVPESE
jgi:protein-tyrosine-phosphatase/DNA-binding HxlR family transcriptional regulator